MPAVPLLRPSVSFRPDDRHSGVPPDADVAGELLVADDAGVEGDCGAVVAPLEVLVGALELAGLVDVGDTAGLDMVVPVPVGEEGGLDEGEHPPRTTRATSAPATGTPPRLRDRCAVISTPPDVVDQSVVHSPRYCGVVAPRFSGGLGRTVGL